MQEQMPSWVWDVLQCPVCCKCAMAAVFNTVNCTNCHASYPVVNGVPLLLPKTDYWDVGGVLSRELGGLDPNAVKDLLASALTFRHKNLGLRQEFSNIVERYQSYFPPEQAGSAAKVEPQGLQVVAEYFAPEFQAGKVAFRSLRLRNHTSRIFATEGETPHHLSYQLFDAEGQALGEGPRSIFPVPLKPGAELTVPLRVAAPEAPGRYRVDVYVVHELVRWMTEFPLLSVEIDVGRGSDFRSDLFQPPHSGHFEMDVDLERCGEFIRDSLQGMQSEGCPLLLLEVACGSDPQLLRHYQPGTRVIASDLCYPQTQFGAMLFAKSRVPRDAYIFGCADVFAPPFRPGVFDAVVVSAALHHFSNLVDALRSLSRMLRPGGKLILMREPGKVFPEDPIFIEELAAGFNEQQFELEEYELMFQRAALTLRRHRLDFECSYKAELTVAAE